jgi:hypothetical protein
MPLGFVMNEPGELFHEANKKKKKEEEISIA